MKTFVLCLYIVLFLLLIIRGYYALFGKRKKKVEYTVDEKSAHNDQILSLLTQGKKISAIKKTREIYPHFGLKEAKDYVEALENKQKGF